MPPLKYTSAAAKCKGLKAAAVAANVPTTSLKHAATAAM
jgi:hypothetical protein